MTVYIKYVSGQKERYKQRKRLHLHKHDFNAKKDTTTLYSD